jgi:hypothetical protein
MEPVLTKPFNKVLVAAMCAIKGLKIVGIIGADGLGFTFALSYVARKHWIKVVVCDVEYGQKLRNVLVSLNRMLSNIKLPRVTNKPASLHEVVQETNQRVRDGDAALIVFDNCSRLTRSQLRYLILFLRKYNRRTGIMFRMSPTYLKSVKRRWPSDYKDLKKATDEWGVLPALEADDFRDVVRAHGITDTMLIDDLVNGCEEDLAILGRNIERVKKSLNKSKS